jgi:hypothetical protein
VGIGEITKQFAKEAIGDQVKDLLGTSPAAPAAAGTQAGTSDGDGLASVLMGQVQAMQNVLKEDQELVVQCHAGGELIRVLDMFAPSSKVLVLTGTDRDKQLTRIVSPADAVQLTCKPTAVASGAKPVRLRFIVPTAKPK